MSNYFVINIHEKEMEGRNLLGVALYNYDRATTSNFIEKNSIYQEVIDLTGSEKTFQSNLIESIANLLKNALTENKLEILPRVITVMNVDCLSSDRKNRKKKKSHFLDMFEEGRLKSAYVKELKNHEIALSAVLFSKLANIEYKIKGEIAQAMRDFINENKKDIALPEVEVPVLGFEQRLPTYLKEDYTDVVDIHTDGRVKATEKNTTVSFGVNILKRDLEESIYHNFKRIAGYEIMKEDSNFAELKAVETAMLELGKNNKELLNEKTLFRFYVDNECVIKSLQIKKLWRNASVRSHEIFKNILNFMSENNVSVIKVSSKMNKGNKIAHMLAKKAVEMNANSPEKVKVLNPFEDFTLKMQNDFYHHRAKENYQILQNELTN